MSTDIYGLPCPTCGSLALRRPEDVFRIGERSFCPQCGLRLRVEAEYNSRGELVTGPHAISDEPGAGDLPGSGGRRSCYRLNGYPCPGCGALALVRLTNYFLVNEEGYCPGCGAHLRLEAA